MALRYDSGTLGQAERTPQGGLRVPARLTRVGIFEYKQPNGSVRRELRPADEVFAPESMASLKGATVTNLHVAEVTAHNFTLLSKGHVGDDVAKDDTYLSAHVYVQDAELVGLIETGLRKEVSLGYEALMDETPGTWEGQPYDAIQRRIRYNHAALGPEGWGRAGSNVALRLDGGGDEIPPGREDGSASSAEAPKERAMADVKKIEIIGGVEYEVGSEPHRSAVKRRDGEVEDLEAEIEKLKAKLAEVKSKADEEKVELEDENKELSEKVEKADEEKAETEAKMDSIVTVRAAARARLLLAARDHGIEHKADAADHDIRVAVLAKLSPASKFDAKDAGEKDRAKIILDHVLEGIEAEQANGSARRVASAVVGSRGPAQRKDSGDDRVAQARAEYLKRQANAWRGDKAD